MTRRGLCGETENHGTEWSDIGLLASTSGFDHSTARMQDDVIPELTVYAVLSTIVGSRVVRLTLIGIRVASHASPNKLPERSSGPFGNRGKGFCT